MKATNFVQIGTPIKLHLEYDKMNVGELSVILRNWQALLRSVWLESYRIQRNAMPPTTRVLTSAASTEHSFELVSEYAIPALVIATAVLVLQLQNKGG